MTPEELMKSVLAPPQFGSKMVALAMGQRTGDGLGATSSAGDGLWALPLIPSPSSGSSSKVASA
jgi:hypothetical protein